VVCLNTAESGRNILRQGTDVRSERWWPEGRPIDTAAVGPDCSRRPRVDKSYRPPRTAVIATGDEVVTPGSRCRKEAIRQQHGRNLLMAVFLWDPV